MARRLGVRGAILLIALFAPQFSSAYEHPLSFNSIWQAYFLGHENINDEELAAFLASYVKRPPLPQSGPHVASIEIETPYEQVVLRTLQRSVDYSPQQADQDYRAQSDLILVRVGINLTPTYSSRVGVSSVNHAVQLRPLDFWRDFSFRLIQEEKRIAPDKISGEPLFTQHNGGLSGAEVVLEFDATKVSSAPVWIEMRMPEGNTFTAEFDLERLK
ncbi:MAG TPA: hypothetical protein VGV68_06860 [Terriglobia bacterium]|nr:hypothetical protein [Terriglobia bacterium]